MDKKGMGLLAIVGIVSLVLLGGILATATTAYFYKFKVLSICLPSEGLEINNIYREEILNEFDDGNFEELFEELKNVLLCEVDSDCLSLVEEGLEIIAEDIPESVPMDFIEDMKKDVAYCKDNKCFFREPYLTYSIIDIPELEVKDFCDGEEYDLRISGGELLKIANELRGLRDS